VDNAGKVLQAQVTERELSVRTSGASKPVKLTSGSKLDSGVNYLGH
jgi:hypothetical protein